MWILKFSISVIEFLALNSHWLTARRLSVNNSDFYLIRKLNATCSATTIKRVVERYAKNIVSAYRGWECNKTTRSLDMWWL